MSRSKRKVPRGFIWAKSEKDDKRIWHKRLRTHERVVLKAGGEDIPNVKDVSDPWSMAKDGCKCSFKCYDRGYKYFIK